MLIINFFSMEAKKKYAGTVFEENYCQLVSIFIDCLLQDDFNQRPDCQQILSRLNEILPNERDNYDKVNFGLEESNDDDESLREILETILLLI